MHNSEFYIYFDNITYYVPLTFSKNTQFSSSMKTLYKRILAVRNVASEEFPQGLALIMIIFFVLFGTVSMFLLL